MRPTTEQILEAASVAYGLSVEELTQRSRKREILRPRQTVQYMCWKLKTDVLRLIAEKTKVRQHGTILHSHRFIENDSAIYRDTADCVRKLEEVLVEMGFDIGVPAEKGSTDSLPAPYPNKQGKHIPIKVVHKITGEYSIVNSVCIASRLTGVKRQAITNECHSLGSSRSNYNFSYDE